MKILALDPSMSCTGWAVLEADGSEDGKIDTAGTITPDEDLSLTARAFELYDEAVALILETKPDLIVVELPADARRKWPGEKKKSTLHLPTYGIAVGQCLLAARGRAPAMRSVPVNEWAVGLPGTWDDRHKEKRVQHAAWLWKIETSWFGPKTYAGNVVDAVLMARWVIRNPERVSA